ncbi:MAG: DUF917 family protein [Bacillota bacterium]|nr:DUF917 family protein [Bacillota bacterium]MDD3850902.1 DUF917 family protein [Bacillota bacterium]
MSKLVLTNDVVEAAVVGGSLLGGGGGGSMELGRKMASLALNLTPVELVDVEDLDEGSILINVAAVGAPSAKTAHAEPMHYIKAVKLLQSVADIKISGIISNEMGGIATVNGWLQAGILGLPVVDAPCNGRAHPTGLMGAIGLHKMDDYKSIQAAVGGAKQKGTLIETVTMGNMEKAASLIRSAAVQAGGLVAVARNPVTSEYARENAALGAVKQAIELGRRILSAKDRGAVAMAEEACQFLQGEIVHIGEIKEIFLECKGGFDVGKVEMGDYLEVTFWNEYMTLEKSGDRLATFPDLVMTIDAETGYPVTSADITKGQKVMLIRVDKKHLKLGAGMRAPELFNACEEAVGKSIIKYVF